MKKIGNSRKKRDDDVDYPAREIHVSPAVNTIKGKKKKK